MDASSGPRVWRLVSLSPLPVEVVRSFVPQGIAADVVVVAPRTAQAVAQAVAEADIVIGDYSAELGLDAEALATMGRCRLVQQPSAGYEHIDIAAAAEHGVRVANVAGANAGPVAEYTVMVALVLLRGLIGVQGEVRAGGWPQLIRPRFELAGKTWGIVGFGRIGRAVAQRLAGWDVDVVYSSTRRASDEPGARMVELDELLEIADVVSLHVPLRDSTHHLIDARRLTLMKRSAMLVNVARGDVVDEDALVHALTSGGIAGAALDVFSVEPLPADHPLTTLDNVILTPHDSGAAIESQLRIVAATAANIARVMRGETPIDVVAG